MIIENSSGYGQDEVIIVENNPAVMGQPIYAQGGRGTVV